MIPAGPRQEAEAPLDGAEKTSAPGVVGVLAEQLDPAGDEPGGQMGGWAVGQELAVERCEQAFLPVGFDGAQAGPDEPARGGGRRIAAQVGSFPARIRASTAGISPG